MASVKELAFILTGKNAGLLRSLNEAEAESKAASKKMADNFNKGTDKIGGGLKSLEGTLAGFGVPFTESLGRIGEGFDKAETKSGGFGEMLTSLGGPIATAAAAGVALVAVESIKAASEYDTAHSRLVRAVENTGVHFGYMKDEVEGADKQLRGFGYTDTETESALAKLTAATHDTRKSTELMGLAANVARGRNMSLSGATDLLVKVESGHVSLLGRLGINTKDATGATISQEEAIRRLADLYRGDASAYANTFAGKLAVLKANADTLEVSIGERLIPVVNQLTSSAVQIVNVGSSVDSTLSKWHLGFSDILSDTLKTVPGLRELSLASSLFHHSGDDAKKTATDLASAQKRLANDVASGHASHDQLANDSRAVTDAQKAQNKITAALTDATNKAAASETKSAEQLKKEKAAQTAAATATKQHKAALDDLGKVVGPDMAKVVGMMKLSTGAVKDLTSRVKTMDSAFTSSFDTATNVVDQFKDKSHVSFNSFVADELKSLSSTQHWADNLGTLAKDGIDKNFLETLAKAGPSSAGLVQAILDNVQHGSVGTVNKIASAQAAAKAHTLQTLNDVEVGASNFTRYINGLNPQIHVGMNYQGVPTGIIQGNVRRYAQGGWVDAPAGQAVPAIVHGGEFVVSREMMKKSGGGHGAAGVPPVIINVAGSVVTEKQLTKTVLDGLIHAQRKGATVPWVKAAV